MVPVGMLAVVIAVAAATLGTTLRNVNAQITNVDWGCYAHPAIGAICGGTGSPISPGDGGGSDGGD